MRTITKYCVTLIILLGIILIFQIYQSKFNITEADVKNLIQEEVKAQGLGANNLKYEKEVNENGLKIILFSIPNKSDIGVGVFKHGINFKYKKEIITLNRQNYVFSHRYFLKTFSIIAGENSNKKISYIGIYSNKHKLIKENLESGYYIKFINMKNVEYFNAYDKEGLKLENIYHK